MHVQNISCVSSSTKACQHMSVQFVDINYMKIWPVDFELLHADRLTARQTEAQLMVVSTAEVNTWIRFNRSLPTIQLTNYLILSMEESPFWEADSHSLLEKFPASYGTRRFHSPTMSWFSKWPLAFRLYSETFLWVCHVCYITCPSLQYYHPNNNICIPENNVAVEFTSQRLL